MIPKNLIPSKPAYRSGRERLNVLILPAIIVLVGLTAFGLGRLSALQEQKGELKVYGPKEPESRVLGVSTGEYVASKSGTKYYLSTCTSAKNIKEENKIWFPTATAAKSAGYAPAANCPGL